MLNYRKFIFARLLVFLPLFITNSLLAKTPPPPPPSISNDNTLCCGDDCENEENESEDLLNESEDSLKRKLYKFYRKDPISIGHDIVISSSMPHVYFGRSGKGYTYVFANFIVDMPGGMIDYEAPNNRLFIDDLIITEKASLLIYDWNTHRNNRIFVKKTSQGLGDALSKISFAGSSSKVGARDYDEDYWEIGVGAGFGGIPEPLTYGAILSLSALGFVAWRRRGRRSLASAS